MINLHFNIRNPFSDRFEILKSWEGNTVLENKFWELQINKTTDVLGFDLRYNIRQDHAGMYISLAFLGYECIFNLYDSRHWDYERNTWHVYDKQML